MASAFDDALMQWVDQSLTADDHLMTEPFADFESLLNNMVYEKDPNEDPGKPPQTPVDPSITFESFAIEYLFGDVGTVFNNTGHLSTAHRAYVVLGFAAGDYVGVRGVDDFFWLHDAADGHEQSDFERRVDGATGAVTLLATGFGAAQSGKAIGALRGGLQKIAAPKGTATLNGSYRLTSPAFSPDRARILSEISDLKAAFRSKKGTFVPKLGEAPIDLATGRRIFGEYNSATNTITFYKDFDLSTMAHELLHFKQANLMNRLGKNLARTPDQIPILERQVEQWLYEWTFTPRF